MLEGAGDVSEVGRTAEQITVGRQHVRGRTREGWSPDDLDALDLRIGRAGQHRLEHLLTVR